MALEPLPAEVAERTVPALLGRLAEQRGDAVALIAPGHGGEARLTWSELEDRAARLAGFLADRGVGRGDRVAILLDQAESAEAHVAYHASHRLGAINVPLNVRYVERELAYVLGFTAPRAVVFSPRFAPLLERLAGELPPGVVLVEAGSAFEAACQGPAASPSPAGEYDDADWIFTSGTTGNPKAVALTHANSVACGHQARRLWGLDADSVYQSFAPFFTSTGCHTNLLAVMAAGCTYVVEPEFDVRETLRRVERYGTTSIFLISGVIALMLDRVAPDELEQFDLGSLRRIAYGGQAMSKPFYEQVLEVFEQRMGLELVHLWGLTEGGTSGLLLPPERHAEGVARAGELGLAIGTEGFNEWVRFRVAREDDDADSEPGEVGELCLRGPAVMDRYVADEAATSEALRGGWLHTGDMGLIDEDGFVYFVDRRKQMIRRGGLNISSAEVEGVIMQHPAVLEVAVVAKPNPILEQEVKAVVVLRDGQTASAEAIVAFCRERLADYKVPVEVAFIDALPRNAMNRVVKGALTGEGSALGATAD
jgi:acyl-CoA synthetase (AMP-forming)/AMP-acid ligase II